MSTDLAHVERPGIEIEPVATGPLTIWRSEEPNEIIAKASTAATALATVVRKQGLTVGIQGREYCKVEAWTLCGSMLGVFPVCVWTRPLENGWEARVEARTMRGDIVGAAEAQCLRSEGLWAKRDDYALRSMAQTRATSKALRQPLGFVMSLAGLEATPAEEMPHEDAPKASGPRATKAQLEKIKNLMNSLDEGGVLSSEQFAEGLHKRYGADLPPQLSKDEADDLIDRLNEKYKEAVDAVDAEGEPQFKIPEGAAK